MRLDCLHFRYIIKKDIERLFNRHGHKIMSPVMKTYEIYYLFWLKKESFISF